MAKKMITNERIGIFLLSILLVIFIVAYIRLENDANRTATAYAALISTLNLKDPSSLIPLLENKMIEKYNLSPNIHVNIKYIGITNGLYAYNFTANQTSVYIFSTLDGAYLFVPYATNYLEIISLGIDQQIQAQQTQ